MRRVLLVDDHPESVLPLKKILQLSGYDVFMAMTVAEAISCLDANSFDFLISDVGLPDGNGLDIMRYARSKSLPLVGIVVSGYTLDEDVAKSRDAGFALHMSKPLNFADLQKQLASLVA